jgi:hypothetical protein
VLMTLSWLLLNSMSVMMATSHDSGAAMAHPMMHKMVEDVGPEATHQGTRRFDDGRLQFLCLLRHCPRSASLCSILPNVLASEFRQDQQGNLCRIQARFPRQTSQTSLIQIEADSACALV